MANQIASFIEAVARSLAKWVGDKTLGGQLRVFLK